MKYTAVRHFLSLALGAIALASMGCAAELHFDEALAEQQAPPRAGSAPPTQARPDIVPVRPRGQYAIFVNRAGGPQIGQGRLAAELRQRNVITSFEVVGNDDRAAAAGVARLVKRLIDGGVWPRHIVLIAAGTAAPVLAEAARLIDRDTVGYVLIDGCGPGRLTNAGAVLIKGRFLSIVSQNMPGVAQGTSCRDAFAGRATASGFVLEEVTLRPDPAGPTSTMPQLMIVEAIAAWTRGPVSDDMF